MYVQVTNNNQQPQAKNLGMIKLHPVSIIVAVDEDGGFGKGGKIPWHYKEDFDHFKEVTKDSVCIMGRKTYEDMLAMVKERRKKNNRKGKIDKILPGRDSYVVTSNADYKSEGATTVTSIRAALEQIKSDDKREVFILGGRRMFVEALAWANKVYLTLVKGRYECDVFFPVNALEKFKITEGKETDDLYFVTYTR